MPNIVGLCGGMGSGKTGLARSIMQFMGDKKCRLAAFGDRLKELVSSTYGIQLDLLHSERGKSSLPSWVHPVDPLKWENVPQINYRELPSHTGVEIEVGKVLELNMAITEQCVQIGAERGALTCGRLLQVVGEAFRRLVGRDVWVTALFSDCTYAFNAFDFVIIDDVRHDNEADWVLSRGGCLIQINSDPPSDISVAGRDRRHPSEIGLRTTTRTICVADLGKRTAGDFDREGQRCAAKIRQYFADAAVPL